MIYKPENVKLVITHDGVEQEIIGFDESTYSDECSVVSGEQMECVFQRVSKSKSSRCKDTIDWVEVGGMVMLIRSRRRVRGGTNET